jgi:uncharacterized NAD(P)/FAD-binding protein YdhS
MVIVGDGVSGVAAFVGLMRDTRPARVDIVDPGQRGESLAFPATQNPALLCNTSLETMSLLADKPDDFLDYLRESTDVHGRDFVARFHFSQYVSTRYWQYRKLAHGLGIRHAHVPATAIAIRKARGGYRVLLADGRELEATGVLVCIGHGAPVVPDAIARHRQQPLVFTHPYPEEPLLGSLPARSRVLVLGSSLSAIDAALLVCGLGHSVVMASPSGALPAVRTATPRGSAVPVDEAGFARLDLASPKLPHRVLRLLARASRSVHGRPLADQVDRSRGIVERLRHEAALAASGSTDWQELLLPHVEHAGRILAGQDPATRKQALAHCWKVIGRYLSAFPLQNAERLLAHIARGRLGIVARTLAELERRDTSRVAWTDHSHDEFDARLRNRLS